MNPQIRELAISSGIYDSLCDPYDSHNTGDAHGSVMDDLEKFAELIVRECVEWCDAYATIDGTAQQIRDAIKNHFGVEESKQEKFEKSIIEAFKNGVDLSGQETP